MTAKLFCCHGFGFCHKLFIVMGVSIKTKNCKKCSNTVCHGKFCFFLPQIFGMKMNPYITTSERLVDEFVTFGRRTAKYWTVHVEGKGKNAKITLKGRQLVLGDFAPKPPKRKDSHGKTIFFCKRDTQKYKRRHFFGDGLPFLAFYDSKRQQCNNV